MYYYLTKSYQISLWICYWYFLNFKKQNLAPFGHTGWDLYVTTKGMLAELCNRRIYEESLRMKVAQQQISVPCEVLFISAYFLLHKALPKSAVVNPPMPKMEWMLFQLHTIQRFNFRKCHLYIILMYIH
jgi:hypothetical protein